MPTARCVSVLLMAFMAVPAVAGEGLKVNPASSFWYGEGSNIRLNALWVATAPSIGQRWAGMGRANPGPAGAAVVGDYYFSAATPAQRLNRSGFRASSGLLIKQPGVSLSELAWSSRAAATFGTPAHLQLSSAIGSLEPSADTYTYSTMPYVGIGYSGIHAKSGWGFWADVGLVMQNPGNMLGVGRVVSGSQSAEDLVRELRLSPLLQLGVNYSF